MAAELTMTANGLAFEYAEQRPLPAAPAPSMWMTAREIGFELDCSDRHVRRLAHMNSWRRKAKKTNGGKSYEYRRDDVMTYLNDQAPKPSKIKASGDQIPLALGIESDDPVVLSRFARIKDLMEPSGHDLAVALKVRSQETGVSTSTLRRWIDAYREHGPEGLADRRGGNSNARKVDENALKAIFTLYANRQSPTLAQAHKAYCALREMEPERNLPEISLGTLRRHINQLGLAVRLRKRGGNGPKAARQHGRPSIHRDWSNVRVMEYWMGDGTALDLMVRWPGYKNPMRPWLMAWIDVRSRMIVAWRLVAKVNGETALLTLRDGWQRFGLCDVLYVDNGREYKNKNAYGQTTYVGAIELAHVKGYLDTLQRKMIHAWPGNPRAKAPIERWFNTLSGSYLNLFPGYTGGNITSMTRKKDDYRLKQDLKNEDIYDADQARELLAKIVDAYNTATHSSLDGRSPMEVFDALHGKTADGSAEHGVEMPKGRVLDFALKSRQPRLIRNDGVEVYKTWYRSDDEAFLKAVGRKGYIAYDPDDLTSAELYAFDSSRRPEWVCTVYPYKGICAKDADAARAAIAKDKADGKVIARAADLLMDRSIEPIGLMRATATKADSTRLASHRGRFVGNAAADTNGKSAQIHRFPTGGISGTPKPHNPTEEEPEEKLRKGLFTWL